MSRPSGPHAPFFPAARYTSLVGVHASLTLFTALFLPRTVLHDVLPAPLAHALPARAVPAARQHFLDALTVSPPVTLAWLIAGLAVLQAWWAGWLRAWAAEYQRSLLGGAVADDAHTKEEERLSRTGSRGLIGADVVPRVRDAALCTGIGAGLLCGVLVLAGAPLSSHIPHTALLALLLSLLAIYPSAYVLGPPLSLRGATPFHARLAWTRVFAELAPRGPVETALLWPALGALGSAWASAALLALDWERSWQKWPLPPAYAAVLGSVLGALGACVLNCVRALADVGRARAEAEGSATDALSGKEGKGKDDVKRKGGKVKMTGKEAEKFEGNAAVEEMRKSVQAVLQGMGSRKQEEDEEEGEEEEDGAAGTAGKKKRRRRRRGGKGQTTDDAS